MWCTVWCTCGSHVASGHYTPASLAPSLLSRHGQHTRALRPQRRRPWDGLRSVDTRRSERPRHGELCVPRTLPGAGTVRSGSAGPLLFLLARPSQSQACQENTQAPEKLRLQRKHSHGFRGNRYKCREVTHQRKHQWSEGKHSPPGASPPPHK